MITAGIDLGTGAVKTVLFKHENGKTEWLAKRNDRIRTRDPLELSAHAYDQLLKENGLTRDDITYCATTGDGENIDFRTGHFYSMTTHSRGAIYLDPEATGVLDMGALHGRAMKIDNQGKVLNYRMTSQCASGSGQFLENISRYLGIAQDEIGTLSRQADDPEIVSSICAVLAETDVINMVSRGISAPNILKGIHLSMAGRLAKLLRVIKATEGVVLCTGGLALDSGMIDGLNESMQKMKLKAEARSHEDSAYAGAIGAALWGAFRHEKLRKLEELAKAS
ncbi:benzoyl-CoA reductase subunit D [Motiliproteus sp. MSK22-1]|uniref:benzoyl-CoA reductase subunit D n=1 Tax=Motiliproteus sp. MSK22-1 TaxID=1897630 RepID=UPI0009758A96|nr:benzoyl-CoA reductase subunit D [Motiliproteus sp. MSK22-1]OMH35334.1 benzoyl-CoA reductase subunit D [Motiliproteus sp. MSK22-1]